MLWLMQTNSLRVCGQLYNREFAITLGSLILVSYFSLLVVIDLKFVRRRFSGRIDHLQVAQADVATLPGQAVLNGGELLGRDFHACDCPAQSRRSQLVLTRPNSDIGNEIT